MSASGLDEVMDRVERIAPLIRDRAAASEAAGNVDPEVVAAFRDAGLFGMLTPVELGGLGMTLPEFIRVTERVAEIDASTGLDVHDPRGRAPLRPEPAAGRVRESCAASRRAWWSAR